MKLSIRYQILIPLVISTIAGLGVSALIGYQARRMMLMPTPSA